MDMKIRRIVSIPKVADKEDVLALIEVGGKMFNKDLIYQKFFSHGAKGVKQEILDEIKTRGGNEKDFQKMMKQAQDKNNG